MFHTASGRYCFIFFTDDSYGIYRKKEAKKKYTSRLDKVHKEKTFDFVSGWF